MSEAIYSIVKHYQFKIGEQSTIEGVERIRSWVEEYILKDSDEYNSLQEKANSRISLIETHPEMFQKQEPTQSPPNPNEAPNVAESG